MPRTKKYDVTESLASLASSQQTIISHVNENNNCRAENIFESSEIPKRRRKCPVGWIVGGIFSIMSLTFILCAHFLSVPGVPTSSSYSSSALLQKRGYLKVYPYLPDENTDVPGMYSIPLPTNTSYLDQMNDIINSYPEDPSGYSSCFVDFASYKKPCFFEKNWLGNKCTKENQFGYLETNDSYSPCILLQISDSFDWSPIIYNRRYVEESWIGDFDPTFASVGCSIKDVEERNQVGSIDVYPIKGFSTRFFPVSKFDSSLYLLPSVMIQVKNITVGSNITIECWLRAINAYLLKDSGQITISFVQETGARTLSTDSTLAVQSSEITEQSSNEVSSKSTNQTGLNVTDNTPTTVSGGLGLNQRN